MKTSLTVAAAVLCAALVPSPHAASQSPTEFTAVGRVPVAGILPFGAAMAPPGFLMCDGAAVSRTTYAKLFQAIGTTYGPGDGSHTFNLPDLRQRFPLGVSAGPLGTGAILGEIGGLIDHRHAVPNHDHAVADHSHSVSAHVHTVPAHAHTVAAHSHGKGNLNVGPSGEHTHFIAARRNGTKGAVFQLMRANGVGGATENGVTDWDPNQGGPITPPSHTHPSSAFSGRVGALSGANGDANQATSSQPATSTLSGGAGTTGSGGPDRTEVDGPGMTKPENPPYLALHYIIKA